MDLKRYFRIDDNGLRRLEDLYADYRRLYSDPDRCRPMIVVDVPVAGLPSWEERLADPLVMLKAELDGLRPHLRIRDDRAPTIRVQFGTAQVAAAFGCAMHIPPNNLPAAGSHVLTRIENVRAMNRPALDAGWYGKLAEWTAVWKEHLPEGVRIQHPDIQSAFNSAHLIRGNDIFLDLYDCPEEVGILLDLVTDFMIDITRHAKRMIGEDSEWFFDWGAMWKGCARISNCSMQMIGPEFYRRCVLPRDVRFFEAVGGGRIHYCGAAGEVLDEYFRVPHLSGLDVDCAYHDFFALCDRMPAKMVLTPTIAFARDSREVARLLAGDWPRKRNIILRVDAASEEEGAAILERLRNSIP
jgi:hypothetical protein